MDDTTAPAPAAPPTQPDAAPIPTEAKPAWVKRAGSGKVEPVWKPEDIKEAHLMGDTEASEAERNAAYVQHQAQGWKGAGLSVASGVTGVVPFAHQALKAIAPGIAEDVEKSDEEHPIIKAVSEVGSIAASVAAGVGVPAAIDELSGIAGAKVAEAAGESAIAGVLPSLSAKTVSRLASNAMQGVAYSELALTNEKDLPHNARELAEGAVFAVLKGIAGGVAGGELGHAALRGASALARGGSKAMAAADEALQGLAAKYNGGGDAAELARAATPKLQASVDLGDKALKDIDKNLMGKLEKKIGFDGMAEPQAKFRDLDEQWQAAKDNALRVAGGAEDVPGKETGRRFKVGKVFKAYQQGASPQNDDLLKSMTDMHGVGKKILALHEELSAASASAEDVTQRLGSAPKGMDDLLDLQAEIRAGVVADDAKQAAGGLLSGAGGLGAAAELLGHHATGGLLLAARAGKMAWSMAPAEFKAATLGMLARTAEGVSKHLDTIADATFAADASHIVAPAVTVLTAAKYHEAVEHYNSMASNPTLLADRLHEQAGHLADVAPDAYGQMAITIGNHANLALNALLGGPQLQGSCSPKYTPSAGELRKASDKLAVIRDPRVFEAKLAKGTATADLAAVYKQAWPERSYNLGVKIGGVLADLKRTDKASVKAMTGLAVTGLGTPRQSYSQPMLARLQGAYALAASQKGGPGSRGGMSGAGKITSAQSIKLPGQAVSERMPKP